MIFNKLPTGVKSSIISSQDDSMSWPFFNQTYLVMVRLAKWFSSRQVKLTTVPYFYKKIEIEAIQSRETIELVEWWYLPEGRPD